MVNRSICPKRIEVAHYIKYNHESKTYNLSCVILYICKILPASINPFFGLISKKIRYLICRNIFEYCGSNVNIERLAWFGTGRYLRIGDNSGIGINAHILNNTIIGNNVMMGPNCYMLESSHLFDRTDITMIEQGVKKERDKVIIGNDVWIGRDVMIIGSKEIKTGSIIGARCVLTKSFPEYSVIGGNPSILIRSRLYQ